MSKLAFYGGQKTKTTPFPRWPISEKEELHMLEQVIKSGNWWRMTGKMVLNFEREFAKIHDAKYCLGVTNGTQAIELVLAALDIKAGDEVIVPAFTFISTFTAPIYENIVPVPIDVDKDTFCITPELFEKSITKKTKAIIVVHMAGHMCDMKKISDIAKKHGIKVIEDAAHAHGASRNGYKVGHYADAATFSFQNGKVVTCGEGGAIITNNKELYDRLYLIHGVGRPLNDKNYRHVVLGTNSRMNEFQGAILLAQIKRLESFNEKRERNARRLNKLLSNVNGIVPQKQESDITVNTHYMYMFYYDKRFFGHISRDEFVDLLKAEGIPAFISYPVVSEVEFCKNNDFRGHIRAGATMDSHDLTNSKKIADEVIWLPHQVLLGTMKDLEEIADAIIKIQKEVTKVE